MEKDEIAFRLDILQMLADGLRDEGETLITVADLESQIKAARIKHGLVRK